MLVLVALILLLPRVHGQRGRRRAAQLLSTRRLVLDVNRRRATPGQGEREITVRSERQLRDAAAAATDVDTRIVFVSEEIVLRSAVHIRSRGAVVLEGRGSEPTTIRCRPDGAATALFVRGADVRLERLRFVGCGDSAVVVEPDTSSPFRGAQSVEFDAVEFAQNGRTERPAPGAAVRTESCPGASCRRAVLRFHECVFLNNSGLDGGAIFAENADLDIRMSTFEGNAAASAGGAIYASSVRNASLTVEDSEFARNAALGIKTDEIAEEPFMANGSETRRIFGTGGAILARSLLSIDIRASVFSENTGCQGGGAVSVLDRGGGESDTDFDRVFFVSDTVFQDNVAFCRSQRDALNVDVFFEHDGERGGALAYEAMDDLAATWRLKDSLFLGNRAVVGGAMYFRGMGNSAADSRITACQFDRNAAIVSGGSLCLMAVHMTISRSRFRRSRSIFGGIILSAGPTLLKTERDPDDPEAVTVLEEAYAYYGGAIASNSGGLLDLSALVIRNNTAYGIGGGLTITSQSMTVAFRDMLIEDNRAIVGGGIDILDAPNVTFATDDGRPVIIRNNIAAVGGGVQYLPGSHAFSTLNVEGARFSGNKALRSTSSEIARLIEERRTFSPIPSENTTFPDVDAETGHLGPVRHLTASEEGCGGGFNLELQSVASFSIVEIAFQNALFAENEAVVGGGMAVRMEDLYWNKSNRTSCFTALFGITSCQRFLFHNVTVTRNRAEYAGGVFSSLPDGIAFSCRPGDWDRVLVWQFNASEPKREQMLAHCSDIYDNECLGRVNGQGANAGSNAAQLSVVGHRGPLKTVASGEKLAVPCEEDRGNVSCSAELRIVVEDAFNQTITRGIADANLTLALVSESITGGLRYTTVEGVAVIDSTFAYGIGISDTLTIVSESNPSIRLEIPFSTRECHVGETTVAKECSLCPRGFYGLDPSLPCRPCESHAECHGGAAMVPQDGYWHSNPFSPVFRECIHAKACVYDGRRQKLESFYGDPDRVLEGIRLLERGPVPSFADYPQCSEAYEGFLCGSCASGFGHSYEGNCEECPSGGSSTGFLLLSCVWPFFFVGVFCAITLASMGSTVEHLKHEERETLRDRRHLFRRTRHISRTAAVEPRRSGQFGASPDAADGPAATQDQILHAKCLVTTVQLTETLKILINYLQITSVALGVHLEWRHYVEGLLTAEASLSGLSFAVMSAEVECSFQNGTVPASIAAAWTRLAVPWIVLVALLLVCVLGCLALRVKSWRSASASPSSRISLARLVTYLTVISLVSIHFFYLKIVRELLRAVNCVEVEELLPGDHPYKQYTREAMERQVWAADMEVTCFQGAHLPLDIVGFLGLALALLFVLLIIVWLPLNTKHRGDNEFIARYWFIYRAYRKEWFRRSWESVILTRKTMIAAVVSFSVHLSPSLQATLCAGILIMAVALQALVCPFQVPQNASYFPDYAGGLFRLVRLSGLGKAWVAVNNSIDLNYLETLSLVCSIVVFYSAVISIDPTSSPLGCTSMFVFAFVTNVAFFAYVLYRMYAGIHLITDLKLELLNPDFLATYENGMGLLSFSVKIRSLVPELARKVQLFATMRNIRPPDRHNSAPCADAVSDEGCPAA